MLAKYRIELDHKSSLVYYAFFHRQLMCRHQGKRYSPLDSHISWK